MNDGGRSFAYERWREIILFVQALAAVIRQLEYGVFACFGQGDWIDAQDAQMIQYGYERECNSLG